MNKKSYGELEKDIDDIKRMFLLMCKYGLSDRFLRDSKDVVDRWGGEVDNDINKRIFISNKNPDRKEHGSSDIYDTDAWKLLKKAVKGCGGIIYKNNITVEENGYDVLIAIKYKFKNDK